MIVKFCQQATVAVLIAVTSIVAASADAPSNLAQRRHDVPPQQKHAPIVYPVSQESAYMISPCKPERDGYFGSTSGSPAVIQYGFELETIMTSATDITDALDTIREHVMDMILSDTYPSVCGYDLLESPTTTDTTFTTNSDSSITGFHFGDDYDALQSCLPQQSMHNDCSIFTGLLSIYGTNIATITLESLLNLLVEEFPTFLLHPNDGDTGSVNQPTMITNTDNNQNRTKGNVILYPSGSGSTTGIRNDNDETTIQMLIQYGTTRLNASDSHTIIVSIPTSLSTSPGGGLHWISTIFPLVLLILCIVFGISIIVRYLHAERQIDHFYDNDDDDRIHKPSSDPTMDDSSKGNWNFFRKKNETDRTEMSSSSSSSSISNGSRSTHIKSHGIPAFRKVRALCHPTRRRRRIPMANGVSIEFSTASMHNFSASSPIEPDSIYIVESDDDDDDDDDNNNDDYVDYDAAVGDTLLVDHHHGHRSIGHEQRQARLLHASSTVQLNVVDGDDDDDEMGQYNDVHQHNDDPLYCRPRDQ